MAVSIRVRPIRSIRMRGEIQRLSLTQLSLLLCPESALFIYQLFLGYFVDAWRSFVVFMPTGRNDSGEENVPLDLSRGGFSPVSDMLAC